jgi:pimeloyl-ACP methyl ester carboxylesterase
MGGTWALWYALARPERVRRLVLLGAAPLLPGTPCSGARASHGRTRDRRLAGLRFKSCATLQPPSRPTWAATPCRGVQCA